MLLELHLDEMEYMTPMQILWSIRDEFSAKSHDRRSAGLLWLFCEDGFAEHVGDAAEMGGVFITMSRWLDVMNIDHVAEFERLASPFGDSTVARVSFEVNNGYA